MLTYKNRFSIENNSEQKQYPKYLIVTNSKDEKQYSLLILKEEGNLISNQLYNTDDTICDFFLYQPVAKYIPVTETHYHFINISHIENDDKLFLKNLEIPKNNNDVNLASIKYFIFKNINNKYRLFETTYYDYDDFVKCMIAPEGFKDLEGSVTSTFKEVKENDFDVVDVSSQIYKKFE